MLKIGLISDTHNLLRPEAINALDKCDHIIHAGDIARPQVLEALSTIAPLTVIRGNNDVGEWARPLPYSEMVAFGQACIYVLHQQELLDIDPVAAGVQIVVYGHTHQPDISTRNSVLFINPGSAGPRRFSLPVSVGKLLLEEGKPPLARLITLDV